MSRQVVAETRSSANTPNTGVGGKITRPCTRTGLCAVFGCRGPWRICPFSDVPQAQTEGCPVFIAERQAHPTLHTTLSLSLYSLTPRLSGSDFAFILPATAPKAEARHGPRDGERRRRRVRPAHAPGPPTSTLFRATPAMEPPAPGATARTLLGMPQRAGRLWRGAETLARERRAIEPVAPAGICARGGAEEEQGRRDPRPPFRAPEYRARARRPTPRARR